LFSPMKTNYKKIFIVAALTTLVIPLLGLAQVQKDKLCERLSEKGAKIIEKISGLDAKLDEKRAEGLSKIAERQANHDEKYAANRKKWDENRQEQFAKLEERAQTDSQKQAIAQFKLAMTAAINTRRSAVDTAIQAFRSGLQNAIISRKSAADAAVATLISSINSAIEKAKTDCASGVDPKVVRENLAAGIKAARDKFISDKQDIEKLSDSVHLLVTARRQAVEKAHNDFKAAAEQARTSLKAVLGSPSPTPSPSPSPTPISTPTPTPTPSP